MIHWLKPSVRVFGILSLLFISACGFKPMYGQNSESGAGLAQVMANIKIDQIRNESGRQERLSQLLQNNLNERISPLSSDGSATGYILKAGYNLQEAGYGIREDETVTLQNLKLTVDFALVDVDTDQSIMDGTARAIVTYDLVRSDYSNKIARETSLERLSEEVANQIITRIGTYLNENPREAR
ncbi:MAG: LPS assembly lipoprotein LptE [Emcibacteraceae bacterium]